MSMMSPLRYPGGKSRIADWIIEQLPPHKVYIEPFFGGGSVFFAKTRAGIEVVNDLDHDVSNLFQVMRDQPDDLARAIDLTPYARIEFEQSVLERSDEPLEKARRFVVRVWMAHGGKLGSRSGWRNGWAGGGPFERGGGSAQIWTRVPDRIRAAAERLQGVSIDCRPAIEVMGNWEYEDALIYADPPYLPESLPGKKRARYYNQEMSTAEHEQLLEYLTSHPGMVVLSGYQSDLYDGMLNAHGWTRSDKEARGYRNVERTESLWLNPIAIEMSRQMRLPIEAGACA